MLFASWAVKLVVDVQAARTQLEANVGALMAADEIAAAPEPSRARALAPGPSPASRAAKDALVAAVDAGDAKATREAADAFTRAVRADNAKLSRSLGSKWDALGVIVAISLCLGLLALAFARWGEGRRARAAQLGHRLGVSVAELEQAKASAERADQLKTRLLADVSHELRTPMMGLIGGIDLLSHTTLDPGQRKRVDALHESASDLRSLLDDLLDLARLEGAALAIEVAPFDPRRLFEGTVSIARAQAPARGIELDMDPELPAALEGARDRIRQILWNLLSNALKYAGDSDIRVGVRWTEPTLRIEVDDAGPGIEAADRAAAQEAFVRLAAPSIPGTGLGLALTRGLAGAMGGRLRLLTSPRGGLRAEVELPTPLARRPPPPSSRGGRDGPALRVALVEDNEINREIVAEMLRQSGYRVQCAADGQEILGLVRDDAPELILMDCHMPRLDGPAACRRLREDGYRGPIIALTANAGKDEHQACLEAGMDAVLTKPVTRVELERCIERWARSGGSSRAGSGKDSAF